ncbi:MAG: DNA translocase FtsK 4TM domain-containing protein [Geminicoccaceae bacterium]
MAATTADAFAGMRLRARLRGSFLRLGGVLLIAAAVALAIALVGFDWRDPSLNQATAAVVHNPIGLPGAYAADLLYQLFGLAAWLLVAAVLSWGLRLALRRPLSWPWLPVFSLPLALLALAAFLAVLPPLPPARWPLQAGLGGAVGDLQWHWLEPVMGAQLYPAVSLVAALLLAITALGVRWGEGTWAAGRVATGSLWVGRRLGDAAGAATLGSGRLVRDGWRGMDLSFRRRPSEAPAEPEPQAEVDPAVRRARRKLVLERRAEEPPAPEPPEIEPEPKRAPAPAAARRPAPPPEPLPAPLDGGFELPGLDLLAQAKVVASPGQSPEALAETSRQLETVLDDFGVRGEIIDAKTGPVVTLYELEPAPGTRAARVISLADDIARSLCALSVRVAVVPGRNVIGIELPNERRATVYLRELLEADVYAASGARLPIALGKDISGQPIVADLARMPHLLIAGTTGSGKSVAINAMILSLLYRLTPEQLRLIMIDPKVIELSVYEDIPHLLAPVVTDPPKAVVALKWVVRQMDERYRLMSHLGVRDIFAFNKRLMKARADGEELKRRVRTGFEPGTGVPIFEEQPIDMTPLPLIVVIVDEVADLMLTAGKEIENAIQRLSQKARAAGIHLIVATQRPSVDVLTGVIKANLPSRISFRVSSKIDSRTILGEPGAEQLLGQGDMLYLMPGDRISRIHGALVTDGEVEHVVRHLKAQGEPDYHEDVTEDGEGEPQPDGPLFEAADGADGVYAQAVQIVARDGKASTSYLQRKLAIGYNSAAKLIERMENEGLISRADHVGRRHVLMGRGGVDGNEPTDDPF